MNKYVAIDLGSSRISAMAAEVQPNGMLKILAIESKAADDVKHGIVEQVSGAAFKVNEVLKLIQNSAKIPDVELISVSIGAKSMKHISVSVSRFVGASKTVSEQLIAEMHEEAGGKVKGENIAVYDVIPLQYELDGKITDEPEGQNASQITGRYTVIYGNKIIQSELDRCFDRTGIKVEFSPIISESLSAALLDDVDRESGCALINFGATTTTLSIFHKGALQQLLVVPLGGKNITRDIQELGISETNAERLKCLKGAALESKIDDPVYIQAQAANPDEEPVKISTKFLATIIEARLDEILQPIIKAIDSFSEPLEAGIIITGGAANLNYLIDYLNEKTGIYTRFGQHGDWLIESQVDKFNDIVLSQMIGTIILNHEHRQANPLEKAPEKKPKIPKGNLKQKITQRIFDFFSDDNNMN